MSERSFRRSLYWRIGLAIVLILAAVLVVQAALIGWWVAQRREFVPPRALDHLADRAAAELAEALERDPSTDLHRFVAEKFQQIGRPVALVLRDGRVVSSSGDLPAWIAEVQPGRFGRGRVRGGRLIGNAPVVANGTVVAVLVVLPGLPPGTVIRNIGPLLLAIVLVLTVGGAATAALFVFRPAHRRLRALENAAHRLGGGDASARAPAEGGDEIAAVARAFNTMADEITHRVKEVEAADRARRQLIADVSHELMTPLTSMRGYLETLRMNDPRLDAAARERYLDIVHEETLRLERINSDLLDLARLSAGGAALAVGEVSINELFGRVRDRHEPLAREKRVALRFAIEGGATEVCADAYRLEQALQNLAANALRHTPAGGTVTVRARTTRLDAGRDAVVLTVEDTGHGIPAEHLPHVFERFYKVEAARGPAGSGLGLSIVKAIVERHGGQVTVRSVPGEGSVFEIRLPLRCDTLDG